MLSMKGVDANMPSPTLELSLYFHEEFFKLMARCRCKNYDNVVIIVKKFSS